MIFLGYKKCSTSNKAQQWLDDHQIAYIFRPIKEENPTYDELIKWLSMSELPIKKLFNTSGLLYKELNLKDRIISMEVEEALSLLSSNGMLVKRPILVGEDFVLFGFKEDQWKEKLNIK